MEKAVGKLMRILKRQRKAVSFWEWPDAKTKELAIIEEFVASLTGCGGPSLHASRFAEETPPGIIAQDAQGRLVGIEVTPLLDQEAVRQNEREQSVYRDWTVEEVINKIEKRIKETDGKKYHGGPYADLLLFIHTDEPKICYDEYSARLESHLFTSPRQVSKVYLLFSYDRAATGYRCVLLKTG